MNGTTLGLFEQKAYEEAYKAHRLCDEFAEKYELPTDYVYMEFVDPTVASLETVTEALDVASFLVYN